MRTSSVKITLATTVLTALIIATPLEARSRSTGPATRESQNTRIVRLMREAITRVFGPIANARPTIPIPIQEEDPASVETSMTSESVAKPKPADQP